MSNEYAKKLGRAYQKVLSLRRNDEYVINQSQLEKFLEVEAFFEKTTKDSTDAKVEILLEPKEEHGGVTASYIVFDVYGDDVQEFAKIISYCSAVSIDVVDDDMVCISVTIPEVFKIIPKA